MSSPDASKVAWDDLFQKYYPLLKAIAHVSIGPNLRRHYDSSDAAQSVSMALWKGLQAGKLEVRSAAELNGLIRKMIRNKVAQRGRRQEYQALEHFPLSPDQAVSEDSPGETAMKADLLEHVMSLLDSEQQKVLALWSANTPWAEIAAQVGKSVPRVQVSFSRTLNRIRKTMAEGDDE